MRAALEALLRDRKLDVTLTSSAPWTEVPPDRLAATGQGDLDGALGGGLRRGHVSEIVGGASSGRTTIVMSALAAATARGDVAAIVDVCDTFDASSAEAHGVDLTRVLWVRDTGDPVRALKAFSLVLQAGNFGLVVFDLADVPPPVVRRFPMIAGIDGAGTVENSTHPDFKPGDKVILNGWGCGETHLGCYAEKARLKGDWLVSNWYDITASAYWSLAGENLPLNCSGAM